MCQACYFYGVDREFIRDIVRWDVENWSKALPFWEQHLPKGTSLKAAAFGENEGGISLWLAKQGFDVVCTDYTDDFRKAERLHQKYDVTGQISYEKQDISNCTMGSATFDVVVFKSVVGTLRDRELQFRAFSELHRILKPGGVLLFAENLKATRMHGYARRKFTSWGGSWRYLTISETKEMLKPFDQIHLKSHGFLATFGRSERQRRLLGKVDSPISVILPGGWKYILFGACVKR